MEGKKKRLLSKLIRNLGSRTIVRQRKQKRK